MRPARIIGDLNGMFGNSSMSPSAMNGPSNADRLMDELRSPAAVARSLFLIITDLSDPTYRKAHERPRNTWVIRKRGNVSMTVKENAAIAVSIRPVPTAFRGLILSPRKYIAGN